MEEARWLHGEVNRASAIAARSKAEPCTPSSRRASIIRRVHVYACICWQCEFETRKANLDATLAQSH